MKEPTDTQSESVPAGHGCPRGVAIGLNIALGLAVVLTALAYLLDPLEIFLGPAHLTVSKGAKPLVFTAIVLVARALAGWRGRAIARTTGRVLRSGWVLKPVLAVSSVALFFGLFEGVLAIAGFKQELPPIVIKGQEGSDGTDRYMIPDPEMRWRLNPGAMFNGRAVNQMGYFDREVDPEKQPGSMRVICLGDSVTAQGIPPYSGFLNDLLKENPPTEQPWESFNMAVHGYSVTQGLRVFQNRGAALEPDIVTIYFGWNDHWLSGGGPDSGLMGVGMPRSVARVAEALRDFRFFQFMMHSLSPVKELADQHDPLGLRVPQAEYEWTLTELVREIRDAGATPIIMTAPRAEKLTPLLVKNGQTKDLDAVTRLHDDYVELTRKVARDQDVVLLDLAAMWEGPEHAELFSGDGIHLMRAGRIRIADELYRVLTEIVANPLK